MNNKNVRNYRFWVLYSVSFVRTFFYAIYGLALPNYLIYDKAVTSSFVGTISSIAAILYVGGPLIGRAITKKTGSKITLLISASFSFVMMILVVIVSNPVLLIILRSLEGLSNGMFFPEIFNYITSWEKNPIPNGKKIDHLKNFNYSWNFGLILGFLAGYGLVELIGSDFIAMIISVCIAGLALINILLMESDEKYQLHEDKAVVFLNLKYLPQNREELDNPQKAPYVSESPDTSLVNVPLIMGLGGILFFASTKSIFRFTLPYFLEDLSIGSQWVYLIVLGQQVLQIVGLQIIRRFKKMRYGYWASVAILMGSIISILLFPPNIYIIVIINVEMGFFFGLIHGVVQRIILDKGKHYDSKKYTMLSEAFIGISFGVPPIVAGFLLELEFLYVFLFQIGLMVVLISVLLSYHFKYMKKEKLGIFKK